MNLTNTKWRLVDFTDLAPAILEFLPNGELYHSKNLNYINTWKVEGNQIELTINNGYSTRIGKISPEGEIVGHAKNEVGDTWTFKATQIKAPLNLEGTKWHVKQPGSELKDTVWEFLSEGIFYDLNKTENHNTWKIDQEEIYLTVNNGYVILVGKTLEDGKIEGHCKNREGKEWTFHANRIMDQPQLEGTKWKIIFINCDLKDCIWEFRSEGVLYDSDADRGPNYWRLEGQKINISINSSYVTIIGEIPIEGQLVGHCKNVVGKEWTFQGTKIESNIKLINDREEEAIDSKGIAKDINSLIKSICVSLQDYRADENNVLVRISAEDVTTWIEQFDLKDRYSILQEVDNIFKQRYCTKENVKTFIIKIIEVLTKNLNFISPLEFLKNSVFINKQPEGKSQGEMLKLFDELIQDKYGIELQNCGCSSKLYSIYLDDILCTGNTLIRDIKEWSEENFSDSKTNSEAVAENLTTLIFAYVFIHSKNYHKKKAEMRFKISKEIANNHKMYRLIEIENGIDSNSKLDLLMPLEDSQPQIVYDYKKEIVGNVDENTKKYSSLSIEEFFRPKGKPEEEKFFTNSENRRILENAFLSKGIEILKGSNVTHKNMRALGYSLPAHKNFGFGALCFTWRNVPNNTPLVFWYSGGGFIPLFKVKRGKKISSDIDKVSDIFSGSVDNDLPF